MALQGTEAQWRCNSAKARLQRRRRTNCSSVRMVATRSAPWRAWFACDGTSYGSWGEKENNERGMMTRKSAAQKVHAGIAAVGVSCVMLFSGDLAVAEQGSAQQQSAGPCVLQKCQKELLRCLGDEKCFENLSCLASCNGRSDEEACQIRCGDLYNDSLTGMFNMCAVSDSGCVAQKPDEGEYKPPASESTVKQLDTRSLEGRWYIVAGLNSEFDCYDCQVHYFASPEPGTLYGKLNWRVTRPNGQFYQRSDIQSFEQDDSSPGILYNWYNAFLHYSDNWYVLSHRPDKYFLVYYTGSNDAVENYGGAVLYAREPYLDPEIVPEVREAIDRANIGYKWTNFKLTDNTCGPEPKPKLVAPTDLDTAADDVKALEEELVSFGPGLTMFRSALSEEEKKLEKELQGDLKKAEKATEEVERQYKPAVGGSIWKNIFTFLPGL